jgi:hypothetical protein
LSQRRSGTIVSSATPSSSAACGPLSSVNSHAPTKQVQIAASVSGSTGRHSTRSRNTASRAALLHTPETARIGIAAAAPTTGTRASGISRLVP